MPFFGDRPIASIRPSELQTWVRSRAEVLAPATVEVVYRIFAAILNTAVDDRLLARSPASGIRLPRQTRHELQPPTVEQVEALIDAMPDRYKALVVLAAGTGLRQGECFGLTVDCVDFLRRTNTVDRQLILPATGPPQFGPPKTPASVRTVPLPKVVGESLAARLGALAGGDRRPDLHQRARRRAPPQPLRRKLARRRRTGGPRRPPLPRPSPFLRLTLFRHGESVKVVQARLGHASASETLDTYSHLWPDNEERTRAAVDSIPVLVAWGITSAGKPVSWASSPATAESTDAWARFFRGLTARGLRDPLLVISDGGAGLIGAIETVFPASLRQRCVIHRARIVLAKVPVHAQAQVKADFWEIFDIPDGTAPGVAAVAEATRRARAFTAKWAKLYPSAVECLNDDFDHLVPYLRFPAGHWERIRHSNFIERTFGETRRRVKVIGRFPGERSCLSLMWAVLDRASRGSRGVQQTIPSIRLLAEIRRELSGAVPIVDEAAVEEAVVPAA